MVVVWNGADEVARAKAEQKQPPPKTNRRGAQVGQGFGVKTSKTDRIYEAVIASGRAGITSMGIRAQTKLDARLIARILVRLCHEHELAKFRSGGVAYRYIGAMWTD